MFLLNYTYLNKTALQQCLYLHCDAFLNWNHKVRPLLHDSMCIMDWPYSPLIQLKYRLLRGPILGVNLTFVLSVNKFTIRCIRCSWLLNGRGPSKMKYCTISITFLLQSLNDSLCSYVEEKLINLNNLQVYAGSRRFTDLRGWD